MEKIEFIASEIVLDYISINKIEVCKRIGTKDLEVGNIGYPCERYIEYFYKIEISFFEFVNYPAA